MKAKALLALALATIFSVTVFAQEKERRFAFELSGGPSMATREFAEGLRVGFGFDGTFHYRFMPHTGIYAGWGGNWFSTENSSSDENMDYEETGYVLGLQFKHLLESSSSSYFLRAGALYNHIDVENDNGDITGDTGHGPGLQLAAGIDIRLGSSLSLTPVVKYNALSRTLHSEEGSMDIRYHYLTVRVGILKMF